jgi:hypothetical protein
MCDTTTILSKSGVHVATIGFNESLEAWQILIVRRNIVRRNDLEFLSQQRNSSWHEEVDPEPDSLARLDQYLLLIDLGGRSQDYRLA